MQHTSVSPAPSEGCPSEAQIPVNANAGAAIQYDAEEVTGEWIVHQHLEPPVKGRGVTVYVSRWRCSPMKRIEQLADMLAELAASYSVVVETATGYRSDDRKQRRIMIDFARVSITLRRRARLPVGIAKRGRRAVEFTSRKSLQEAKSGIRASTCRTVQRQRIYRTA